MALNRHLTRSADSRAPALWAMSLVRGRQEMRLPDDTSAGTLIVHCVTTKQRRVKTLWHYSRGDPEGRCHNNVNTIASEE